MPERLALSLTALPQNVLIARQAVTGFCEAVSLPTAVIENVRLAVTEACANVVVHAYDADAIERLELDVSTVAGGVIVVVCDRGRGVGDDRGAGLGLPLIAALTEAHELATPDGGGTRITMRFNADDARIGAHV
jgi:anti-sigma regulatory factor (Ser/Thr protein kinase)